MAVSALSAAVAVRLIRAGNWASGTAERSKRVGKARNGEPVFIQQAMGTVRIW